MVRGPVGAWRLALASALSATLALGSCRQGGESSLDLLAPAPPADEGVSFSADVQPILTLSCALSGCHAPPDLAIPGADFTEGNAYGNLVNVPSFESQALSPTDVLDRIEPLQPARSYLYLKITGCPSASGCFGSPMPQGLSPLTSADIARIEQWILEGAPDN